MAEILYMRVGKTEHSKLGGVLVAVRSVFGLFARSLLTFGQSVKINIFLVFLCVLVDKV